MFLWIVLAALTAAVAAVLMMPFARARVTGDFDIADKAGEVEVYRDQLKELERDRTEGLIAPQEAEYARAEIGRRLLLAAGASGDEGKVQVQSEVSKAHSLATAFVTLIPPAIGLCLYVMLGSPGIPDQPLAARLENPGNNLALLVAKAERHLASDPDDGAGWQLLAPIYFRSARLEDAEMAWRNAIRLLGPDPERLVGLGETLIAANDGIITEAARTVFEDAAKLDPINPRPRFYVGLAHEQAGQKGEARAVFEVIARSLPPDSIWMELVNRHIVRNGGSAAGAVAAKDEQQEMIRGMVEGLAARLKQEPDDLDGWMKLVRSYAVLGDRAKAEQALKSGLARFPTSGELVALADEIGIAVERVGQ